MATGREREHVPAQEKTVHVFSAKGGSVLKEKMGGRRSNKQHKVGKTTTHNKQVPVSAGTKKCRRLWVQRKVEKNREY